MRKIFEKVIFWMPFVLTAFIIFWVISDEWTYSFLLALPLGLALIIAWRNKLAGGLIFFASALGYAYGLLYDGGVGVGSHNFPLMRGFLDIWWGFAFFILTGLLFLLAWKKRKEQEACRAKGVIKTLLLILFVVVLGNYIVFGWFSWAYASLRTRNFVIGKHFWYPQVMEPRAINTPEDTYKNFREKLLAGDIEGALEWVRREDRDRYREIFNNSEWLEKYKNIPPVEELKKAEIENWQINYAEYYFNMRIDGEDVVYSIGFRKTVDGVWRIESI